jgi:ERCC4-type nuclease
MNTIKAVMIDSREPPWIQALKFGDAPVAVVALEAGDIHVATSDGALLAIERKEPRDLLNSLRDERLFNQAARLRGISEWAYLVITGEVERAMTGQVVADGHETGWGWNAVQGALLTVQELGVMIIHDPDFAGAVMRLAARKRDAKIIPPARQHLILSPGEAVIASLPGIGLERLEAVLRHCGDPFNALQALTDPNYHINGIGPGTIAQIRQALRAPDGLCLGPLPVEENEHD